MNRRGFLKGLLGAAVAAVARWTPLVVAAAPELPQRGWLRLEVHPSIAGDPKVQAWLRECERVLMREHERMMDDLMIHGAYVWPDGTRTRWVCDTKTYGVSPAQDALKAVGFIS